MIRRCKKNPTRDLGKTIVGLGVNMQTVYETRKVPATSVAVVYNQLSELSQVGYKVNDDFDMIMIARGYESLNGLTANGGTGSSQYDGSKDVGNVG